MTSERRAARTRRREPLPVKGYKLDCHFSAQVASCETPLQEAAKAARDVLLGPVVGSRSYDDEVTYRYRRAAEIVAGSPKLTHSERIRLNASLPWTEAVRLVWGTLLAELDQRVEAVK